MCITNFVESTWKVTKFNTETVENGSSITRRWFNVFGKMVQKHEVFQSSSVRYLRVYIEVLSIVHISQKIQFAKYRAIKKLDWPDSKSNKWRHCSPSVPLYRITIAKFSFSLTSASAIHFSAYRRLRELPSPTTYTQAINWGIFVNALSLSR